MGERLRGHGVPGRRRVHPGGAASGPWDEREDAALESVLAAVLRGGDLDPAAEQRAVVAFRAARDTGAHRAAARARTRRRDDWPVPAERRAGHRWKTTVAVVFGSLALGGVAVAAIGSAGSSMDGDGSGHRTAHPSRAVPDRPGSEKTSPASSGGAASTDGPAGAQDIEAHCRAYEQVKDSGKALDATAWQRLVTAAGGKDKVDAYCAEQLARASATPSKPADSGKPGRTTAGTGSDTAGKTGTSGNSTSGNDGTSGNDTSGNVGGTGSTAGAGSTGSTGSTGGTDNAAGSGQTSGDQGGGKHK